MIQVKVDFSLPLPDDPKKWEGWKQYKSPNYYARLCLDPQQQPSDEIIEEHCRELLRWWQKKLPLKNQPSNPMTQLLRPGLDESSRYLTEARVELLDPRRRRQMDEELAAQAQEEAVAEFHKYLTFAIADGLLTADEEKNLLRFGREHQLSEAQMLGYIDLELRDSRARRVVPTAQPEPEPAPAPRVPRPRRKSSDPREDFMRMLRLSGLDSEGMSDDTRDAFINMAENLGLDAGDAEDIVDEYLDEADQMGEPGSTSAPAAARVVIEPKVVAPVQPVAPVAAPVVAASPAPAGDAAVLPSFSNSLGGQMICIPSGEFVMGSDMAEASPNERPLTKVTLSRFFMSRFPITNAEFEQFDPSHARKRAPGAGDLHPVVYVSSLEAMKFCVWLATRERKRYRLPTEAEWEYAARGTDGRKYPWGNHDGQGDLGNFADKNTVFAWSDREIDDGHAESSPVGAYPLGASPFKIEEMAGNVWEWCHDFYEGYRGTGKVNPRGATAGAKRVYRGGSWKSRFNSLRTTTRGSNVPNYSCNDLGFRVVCDCD
ncbi:MAG: SUMF1/EgtB/PvdO family nonheme iron enzyme [Chthoniobacterales bacterium]